MATLFVPGPVDVNADVALAQTQAMVPHRSKGFEEIFHRAERKTRPLFGTQYRIFLTASSGTGLQEAAVRNFAQTKILSLSNGAFGERWYQVAINNGKQAIKHESPWGEPINLDSFTEALEDHNYEIITVVHNETSTGVMNPINQIAEIVKKISPETLVCVDAVSSLSGVKVEMDAWGVDFILSSSQKCLALPPGLALGATSDRALTRARTVKNRGWYFDLVRLENHRVKNSTPATPAISLIYALDLQLDYIHEEGLENRFSRHAKMATMVQNWALERGFKLYAAEGYRSHTVTTISNTRNIDIISLNAYLLKRGMCIANGYGPLKNKTFRIAHMGNIKPEDTLDLLANIDEFIGLS